MVVLDGKHLTLDDVEAVAVRGVSVRVTPEALAAVAAARGAVDRQFALGATIYGVTTGFGRMADLTIAPAETAKLQENLVRSHAAGTGEPMKLEHVRAAGVLRVSALASGHSGIKPQTLDLLVEILNRGVTPVVPAQGSVGASGDLAPLAHMTLTLIGEGEAYYRGDRMPSAEALRLAGLKPIVLGAKEGLSLVNGTEVMTGIAALSVLRAERLCAAADVIGALSLEAFLGTDRVFDRRINALRPHPGQGRVADNLRALLADSEIMQSHRDCGRVQDPYSFRCIPVVHGAVRDTAAHVRRVVEIESISVTDNPLVFAEDDEFLTGGNFHGQPVSLACDHLKSAMVTLASISERRLYLLLNGEERGLPLFLSPKPGLQSGLMLAQYTAAALVSESKGLAFPSSADSIPTSAGQEDHVSMGTIAARTLDRILENVEGVLACELLGALVATDVRRPLRSGVGTAAAYECARATIAPLGDDRPLAPDITAGRRLLRENALVEAAQAAVGGVVRR
ncbi:MAG: histidine ammonia-lyase [Candidatus Eremiobacteraeota bacterium]|nr:histidine ammonia-lyase [Candidatus Eremiobacteraeota bacterium]